MALQRKSLFDGLVTGVVAAVGSLLVLDLIHLHILAGQPLTLTGNTPLVWLSLALAGWVAGSLLLPIVAAASHAVEVFGKWLGRRWPGRDRPSLARAMAVAALCSPVLATFCWLLFQGQGVARRPVVAALGPWIATLVLMVALMVAWLIKEQLCRWGIFGKALGWILLALGVPALFLADARLFVGLYDFIHLALSLALVFFVLVMIRTLLPASGGRGSGPAGRLGRTKLVALALTSAALGLTCLVLTSRAAPAARSDVVERSIYTSRGLALLAPLLPLGSTIELDTEELTFAEIEAEYLGTRRSSTFSGRRPDILLFSIDAVNADRFPGRGYEREVMPNIEALLPSAIRFDRAYTTIPETQYALPGLIMSTTRELGPAAAVRESGATIASALRQVGYGTYWVYEAKDLFRGGGVLNNLDFEGFDGRWGIDDERPYAASERVIELLERRGEGPLFIWTHLFAPHMPYSPPEEFDIYGTTRSDKYDGELRTADAYVGRVLDYLRDRGSLEETVIIITADHGEWSGEGGRFGHGMDVTERTINVPLIALGPEIEGSRVVTTPVSLLDIGPTLVDLGGGAIPESFEGHSLLRALRGGEVERGPVMSFTAGHGSNAARVDDYKLVFNRDRTVLRLYDIAQDPEAERDLASASPARVREMMAQVATLDLERTVAELTRDHGAAGALERLREETLDRDLTEAERILAARGLGYLDAAETPGAILDLLEMGEVLPAPLRRGLASSLARVGPGDRVEDAWRLVTEDHDIMVRILAIRTLRRSARATDALNRWGDAEDVHLRRAAASLLLTEDIRATAGSERSEQLLTDDDVMVRAMALRGFGRLEVPDEAEAIRRGLADPSHEVRLEAALQCNVAPEGCLENVLDLVGRTDEVGERLALLEAVAPALENQPDRWTELLAGPPALRALAYENFGNAAESRFDDLLLDRLEDERDDRARMALIRAVGQRRLTKARTILIRQHGEDNFALGNAATNALREIGLTEEDVPELVRVFPRASQMQTKVNLLHLFGIIPSISDRRVFDLAERMRRTRMKDHHLMRALVEVYSRLTDPRAEQFRVDNVMYTNFGYQFWLYGYSLRPARPAPGDEVQLKLVWSIRWGQPQGTFNFLHIVGGPRQVPMDRRTVAGRLVSRWPRCRIMVDEVTFQVPEEAERLRILTGWVRRGRLPVVYGEHDNQRRAVIADIELNR